MIKISTNAAVMVLDAKRCSGKLFYPTDIKARDEALALGLIEKGEDPLTTHDRKQFLLLTERGFALAERLEAAISMVDVNA